jgi:VanZ family protein
LEIVVYAVAGGAIYAPSIGGDIRSGSKLAFLLLFAFCYAFYRFVQRRMSLASETSIYGWGLGAFITGPAAVMFFLAERAAGSQVETWVVYPYLTLSAIGAIALLRSAGTIQQSTRIVWLVTALVMIWLVAYFSGTTGSPENFPLFGKGILDWPTIVILTRKTVHIVFYGCFALVIGRVLNLSPTLRGSFPALLACTLGLASIDEFRQSAFPDRSGTWMDVLLDTSAAAIFLQIAAVKKRKREREA